MKKNKLLLTISILALLIAILFLPPSIMERNNTITVACPTTAVTRYITSLERWNDWMPGNQVGDSIWKIGDKDFRISTVLLNGFQALSTDQKVLIDLQFVPAANKQTTFTLRTQYALTFNPIKRILAWITGGDIRNLNDHILNSLCRDFFSDPKRVYGMEIQKGKVTNFSWISTKASFTHYPSTEEVYAQIDALEAYIKAQKAEAKGETILHVQQLSPSVYDLMVAIPTDRDLPSTSRFQLKNMILGSLLSATITGGPEKVRIAEQELENYVKDQQLVSPAIPFQSLVTDRRQLADSTQWISKVNYPIFN
jgi:hypothetical protein